MKNNTILDQIDAAIIISANIEWNVIREIFPSVEVNFSPFGEWFIENISIISDENNVEKKVEKKAENNQASEPSETKKTSEEREIKANAS